MAKEHTIEGSEPGGQGGCFQAWTSTILVLSEVCGEVPKNSMKAHEPEQCAVEL